AAKRYRSPAATAGETLNPEEPKCCGGQCNGGSASLLRPTRRTLIAGSFVVCAYIYHLRIACFAPGICTVAVKPLVSTARANLSLTAWVMETAGADAAQAILVSRQRSIGLPIDDERNIGRTGRGHGDFLSAPFTNSHKSNRCLRPNEN